MTAHDSIGYEGGGVGVLAPPRERPHEDLPSRRRGGGDCPPPSGGGGGGGGGGDGDPWGGAPGSGPEPRPEGTAELGFAFLLMAIVTLFGVFLAIFLFFRQSSAQWPPVGTPSTAESLILGTGVLLFSSAAMAAAVRALSRGQVRNMRRYTDWTATFGGLFLFNQAWVWQRLYEDGLTLASNAYGALFYSFTGLHLLHIVGGLVLLGRARVQMSAARILERWPSRSVRICAVYWHFLTGIWIVLFAVLYFGG